LHACVVYKLHYRFTWWHFTETVNSRREALWPRPLTVDARVQFRISPCGTWVGQTGTGTDFSPHTSVFPPVSIIPLVLLTHSLVSSTLY